MDDEHKRNVFILGPENLSNQFLAYTIAHELNIHTEMYSQSLQYFPEGVEHSPSEGNPRNSLYLIDCSGYDIDQIFSSLIANQALSSGLLAMYNLTGYSEIEGRALTRKVRGFFYIDDQMKLFLKGITSIFKGEVWISRQILLKCAMNSSSVSLVDGVQHSQPSLSPRERQILSLVSLGANNDEISDKLCISVNTVRTHMYHIFKKLDVSNRLQAALWAVKHL